ncbi:MAG: hypothetical protein JST19_09660, partial [Bacteroidetes bacterium]|nr:hypothetical protein [Bacteroidota bacterium]
NESGVVTEKAEYEYWYDNPITQPRLGIKNADWINSFEKFDAGKKVLSVTDMDTNDFLKQYPDEADEDGA